MYARETIFAFFLSSYRLSKAIRIVFFRVIVIDTVYTHVCVRTCACLRVCMCVCASYLPCAYRRFVGDDVE